ncbi:MAG: MauE/DoxX family redox-associated membrane protein [Pseudomonadota bacterium]
MGDLTAYTDDQVARINEKMPFGASAIKGIFFSIWPYRLVRILLAVIFLWSGIAKLIDSKSFAVIIQAYGLIPESWVMPAAVFLPALEIIAALGLLMDIEGSLAVVLGLLILFMAILGYGIWMGLDVDCGCFGPEDPEAKAYHGLRPALYRDMAMMAGVLYLYFWRFSRSFMPVRLRVLFKTN